MAKSKGDILLQDFKGIQIDVNKARRNIEWAAKETRKRLKKTTWERNRKNRRYPSTWRWRISENEEHLYVATVYNETNYYLTWLLENGHIIANKEGGIGWSPPVFHIEPIAREVGEKFIARMKKQGIEVEFLD